MTHHVGREATWRTEIFIKPLVECSHINDPSQHQVEQNNCSVNSQIHEEYQMVILHQ